MPLRGSCARKCRSLAPAVAGIAGLAFAAGAPVAHAAPTWLAPVSLSASGQVSTDARVAMGQNGESVAVWDRGSVVQLSRRTSGGAFAAPIALSAAGEDVRAPQLSIAANDTYAVWERSNATNYVVQAARVRLDGTATAPVDLSLPGADARHPQIATAFLGDAAAVWERSDGANTRIQAAIRPANGNFAPPVDVSAAGQDALEARAVNQYDNVLVTWRRFDGTNWRVQAATRPHLGSFATPVDVSAAGGDAMDPRLAADINGDVIAVWRRFDGVHWIVQAATRPGPASAPGGFSAPVNLSAPDQDAFDPEIATDQSGAAIVVWRGVRGAANTVQAATRATDGTFSAPADLSAPAPNAFAPKVAVGLSGGVVVAWHRFNGTNNVVQAVQHRYDTTFSTPVDVSAPGEDAVDPEVANYFDDATAVWRRVGSDQVVRAAGLDATGPGLAYDIFLTLGPSKGVTGQTLTFNRPPANDTWSAVGSTVWSFGDGTSATTAGASVSHAYKAPGAYQVSIRVSDAVGNTTTASQDSKVVISAAPPVALTLSRFAIWPAAFRAARKGGSTTTKNARPTGARVSYEVSIDARVRFTVLRGTTGRRAAGTCAKPAKSNRAGKRCTRFVRVPGSFTRKALRGGDAFTFTGRMAGKRLRRGRYRLVARATARGKTAVSAEVGFRIAR
jgi:hypothetical protein